MTELQSKILGLLKEIDSLCRANNIEFYLAAGTALGAVRHKGFIPWDDDADICMTKKNWEKFLKLKDQLPEGRELVSMDIDYSCGYTINRYVDSTSMRLYRYHCANPQPAGILIDILVLDPIPDSKKALKEYNIHLTEFCDMLVRATIHSQRTPYKTSYMKYWMMSKVLGLKKTLDIMKKQTFCYDESEETCYYVQRDAIVPHVWKKQIYGKPHYVPFEDTYMPIAEYYYRHLSEAFDEEWMYVPAEIDRENHVKALDLEISYVNAMDDFAKLMDRRKADAIYLKRQRKGNVIGDLKKNQLIDRLKLAEAKVQLAYKMKGVSFDSLRNYLTDKDYAFLDEYFEEYETVQCEKQMIGGCAVGNWLKSRAPVYIDIDDEFLYVFLRNYMRKGGISKAKRILKARERKCRLTAELLDIKKCIRDILFCCTMIEKKEYKQAQDLSRSVMERFPENKYGKRLFYACRYYLEGETGLEGLKKDLESVHDEDEVLLSILAQIYWNDKVYDKVFPIYEQLVEASNHGLVLRYIKENLESYLLEKDDEKLSLLLNKTDWRLGSDTEGMAVDEENTGEGGETDFK